MAQKVEILDLDINTSALIAKMTQTRNEIEKLKASQKSLSDQGQKNSDAFTKNEVELKRLQTSYGQQKNVVSQLTDSTNKFATATQAITSALSSEVNSITSARNNNTQLLKLRNELNLSTDEGKKKLDEINVKLDSNNQFIKENVSAYEQQKIAIGDYKNQIKEAFNELNIFNGGLGGFIERSQQAGGVGNLLTTSLKSMATGIGGVTRASLTFLATPIGAVIGAIGLVLAGVITYLKSTQSGIDQVTSVTRPLQAIMESLFGVLQNVGKALFDAFSNPKKLLSDLADFVKQNLINRFTAFKVILDGIINLDFKKVTDGVIQAGTGLEGMTDKITNASKQTKAFLDEAIKKGQELDRLEKELAQTRIKNKIALGGLTEELKAQNRIAEDQTKSLAERETAAKNSIQVAKEINILKQKELDLEIAILKNKQDRNDTSNEEKLELAELIAKKNEANAQELELATTQQNKLNGIRKEAQAKADAQRQQAIDKGIQQSKEEIDLYIASQGIKKKELDDQLKFEEAISQKRLALLQKEYKAGKISKTAYETEKLNITNDFANKQIELLIGNAQKELDVYKESIQKRISQEGFFSDQKFTQVTNLNNELAKKEKENQALKLQNGVINQTEYNTAIDTIDEENRIKNDEASKTREVAKKEQELIDLENKRASDDLAYSEQIALEIEKNEQARLREVEQAEDIGADVTLINAKYKKLDTDINAKAENAKLQMAQASLGKVAELLGENTALGKASALATATINTYQGITAELATKAITPYEIGLKIANIATVSAIGFKNIAKIGSTKTPKYADGGEVQALGAGPINNGSNLSVPLSNGDNTLAYVKQGEVILNQDHQRKAGGSRFFKSIGVPGFAGGGLVGGNTNVGNTNGYKIDYDYLAGKIAQANQSLPVPVVSVTEINTVQKRVNTIETGANF
jgi:hypothetical protein